MVPFSLWNPILFLEFYTVFSYQMSYSFSMCIKVSFGLLLQLLKQLSKAIYYNLNNYQTGNKIFNGNASFNKIETKNSSSCILGKILPGQFFSPFL